MNDLKNLKDEIIKMEIDMMWILTLIHSQKQNGRQNKRKRRAQFKV